MADAQGGAGPDGAYAEVRALKARIDAIKLASATDRIDQIKADLDLLQAQDPVAYQARVVALRALLPPP